MCRYALSGPYKQHYACFQCRKMFRKEPFNDEQEEQRCPQCRQPMHNMGLDFKAPPKKAREQWRVVEILSSFNIGYHSCGCGGPGYRPRRLRELPYFLQKKVGLSPTQLHQLGFTRRRLKAGNRLAR